MAMHLEDPELTACSGATFTVYDKTQGVQNVHDSLCNALGFIPAGPDAIEIALGHLTREKDERGLRHRRKRSAGSGKMARQRARRRMKRLSVSRPR